jgi:hypothetical protein
MERAAVTLSLTSFPGSVVGVEICASRSAAVGGKHYGEEKGYQKPLHRHVR